MNCEYELARRLLQHAIEHLFDNYAENTCDWEEINTCLEIVRNARIALDDAHGVIS